MGFLRSGSEQIYSYKVASDGKPQMIRTQLRRYAEGDAIPAAEGKYIDQLQAYSPRGNLIAKVESSEISGSRILEYSEYNRNKNVVFKGTPFENSQDIAAILSNQQIPNPSSGEKVGIKYQYDGLGRITQEIYPSGMIVTKNYRPWGLDLKKEYTDSGENIETCEKYVMAGELVYGIYDAWASKSNSEEGHKFNRDIFGQLREIQLAGQVNPRQLFYDNKGRLEVQLIPELGALYYFYDNYGNLKAEAKFGRDEIFHRPKNFTTIN